jgi:hypothetical protein
MLKTELCNVVSYQPSPPASLAPALGFRTGLDGLSWFLRLACVLVWVRVRIGNGRHARAAVGRRMYRCRLWLGQPQRHVPRLQQRDADSKLWARDP